MNVTNESNTVSAEEKDLRCGCGQLMARLFSDGIQMKCKRCKQVTLIPWADIQPHTN